MNSTEQKILQAAREEFIQTGLKGARMQEIADKAGVNKALLHYYFRTKEKLYEESLREMAETLWLRIEMELKRLGDLPDLEVYIRSFVTSYVTTMSENPLFIKLVVREVADGGTVFAGLFEKIITRVGPVPKSIFARLLKEIEIGNIKPFKPTDIFMNIMGMCMITFLVQPILTNIMPKLGINFEFDSDFYQKRIDSIVETIYNGIIIKDKSL